jgi:hypothetical protein
LVTSQKVNYLHSSKREKPMVSRGIVRAVRNQNPPGRFLQKDDETGLWFDIGDQKAREKTSQALREGAPDIRREITNTLSAGETPVIPVPSYSNFMPHANDDSGAREKIESHVHHHYHHQLESAPNLNPFLFRGQASCASNQVSPLPMPDALVQLSHFRAAQALAWATQQQESSTFISLDISQSDEKGENKIETSRQKSPQSPCHSAFVRLNVSFQKFRESISSIATHFSCEID